MDSQVVFGTEAASLISLRISDLKISRSFGNPALSGLVQVLVRQFVCWWKARV